MTELGAFFDPANPSSKAQKRRERKQQKRTESHTTKNLVARNEHQAEYLRALAERPVVFALGPAGTGKTYIPSRIAMQRLLAPANAIQRIIITRPTASPPRHRMGFLPGAAGAKMKPWLVPILDGFRDESSQGMIDKMMQDGRVEVVPFEFMRGRTFHNAFILLDEGQNCSFSDLELLITRTGEDSTLVIAGDPRQVDIEDSGLVPISSLVSRHDLDAAIITFDWTDVVRSRVAAEWVKAFEKESRVSGTRH